MEADQLLGLLPWRPPFLMIDSLVECTPHERIVTRKRVSASDPLVTREGALPRTLLIEGMSQSAALLFRLSRPRDAEGTIPMLGYLNASLAGTALAGQSLLFEVRSVKMTDRGGVFEARARVDDVIVARADLAFMAARPGGRTDEENG